TPAAGAAETSGARWLFVGRLAPNKAAHDIVMALAAYRHVYDPQARLTLVGGLGHDLYTKAVRALVEALDLTGAVEITGPVSDAELASAYEHADVFVCLSDHEGFCFPILEAMSNDLPVIAHSAGAVPDTVGSGGVVLESKSPPAVAAAIHGVLAQPGRRERLIEAGRSRLRNFEPAKTKALFLSEVRRGLARAGLVRNGPVVARGMAESHGEPS
ncbi:MAG TPA: glycosyltransferase, partial [Acidimicrobiales bacterium]|nr:glycosyltransferase [Acidimicrobiales bacterium]